MVIVASGWRWRRTSAAHRPAMPEPTITWCCGIASLPWPGGQANAFEAQHAARAAAHTFAARQAIAAVDGQASPGVSADVDADGTVVRADAALHAAPRVRHDLTFRKHLVLREELKWHAACQCPFSFSAA